MRRKPVLLLVALLTLSCTTALAQTPIQAVAPTEEDGPLARLLDEGMDLANLGRYLDASLRFSDVVEAAEPGSQVADEGRFQLAVALHKLGLNQSALLQFETIAEGGTQTPYYAETLPYLLAIDRETVGDENVRLRLSEYPVDLYPEELADELNFRVGQHYFFAGSYNDALARLERVGDDDGDFFVRARYLEGVIHVQESKLSNSPETADRQRLVSASTAFKTIINYQNDVGTSPIINKIAAMANLALGRLFFSTRQYQVAVRYYDQVDDEDPNWLQSVFEVSWVYYQLKRYGRALGNLHTLNSPFFEDQYFPESRVLQALILFYNCRYDEANAVIKTFVQDYYPLMTELGDEIRQIPDPNAFYKWLARLSLAEETDFSARFKRIFNAALADRRLRRKFVFTKTLTDELKRLDDLAASNSVAEPFLSTLKGELFAYRDLIIGEAGSLAQARLKRVLRELKQHLAGSLKIKGETLKAQRGVLANTIRAEQAAAATAATGYTVDSEHIEWPFSGEYWRDELGSYLYDIKSECDVNASSQ